MPVPKIDTDKIVDTSGAGDAFVGGNVEYTKSYSILSLHNREFILSFNAYIYRLGYLAQFIRNEQIEKCIDCGIWASGIIIQRSGSNAFFIASIPKGRPQIEA